MSETSFKEAWGVLQRHAQTLRNQSEPNIDDLLTIVTESVQAYKVCQSRVEAVEKALQEALKGTGSEADGAAAPKAPPSGSSAPDDASDVPF
jgi:exodeoxyribonuclease VII small subunit